MNALISAGQIGVMPIDKNLPTEDKKNFHELRQALIDAFMSIINGIKSPDDSQNLNNQQFNATNIEFEE